MDMRKVVGFNVLRLRREQGLSQEELSFRSGFGRAYLSGLERGKRNPTVVTLWELSMALGVLPRDLILDMPGPIEDAPAVADRDEQGVFSPKRATGSRRKASSVTP